MLQDFTTETVHNGQSPATGRDWRRSAACRDVDPELFFPVGDAGPALMQTAQARAVCLRCSVRLECLSWALTALPEGVAGGLTAVERAGLRRRRRVSRRPVRGAVDLVDGVDRLVVESLVAGQRVSASPRELAQAAIELCQSSGRGSKWIAGRLGVHDRQVYRWIERHRAGKPLTTGRRVGRVSA